MNSALRIARHELRLAWRSGLVWVLAAAATALMLAATMIGTQRHQATRQQRDAYQATVASQFRDQPDRHPHRVAHYGFLVFRPPSPLGFFDSGLEDHAGSTIFLEAHRQNGATFSDASQSDGLRRVGDPTMAVVLQVFVPVLVFGVAGTLVTREREAGTLPLLLCQGASWPAILWGKWLGALGITALVLLPSTALAAAWLALVSDITFDGDTAARAAMLAILHAAYLAACAAIAIVVSARQSTSRGAVSALLATWVLLWIVVPRLAPMVAASLHPVPPRAEFEARVERRLRELGDSHDPDDPRFQALRRETLAAYGVSRVEDLPVNYNGIVTQEGERLSSEAFEAHQQALVATYRRQMGVLDAASALSPLVAMRQASMALTGTDLPHTLAFDQDAERYRYTLVQALNTLHATEVEHARDRYAGSGERDAPSRQRIDASHWQDLPPFVAGHPTLHEALRARPTPLLIVVGWTMLAAVLLWRAARSARGASS